MYQYGGPNGNIPLDEWEKSFPFSQIHISYMREKVMTTGKDLLSINELNALISIHIWRNNCKPTNETYKLLKALPECNTSIIDTKSFMLLCVLHCNGSLMDKADTLF